MLIASISIFCRKRTTGASSTSEAISAVSVPPVSFVGDVELEVAAGQCLQRLAGARARVLEQLVQLVVLDDHPLGRELGRELDALHGLLVGRVGARR